MNVQPRHVLQYGAPIPQSVTTECAESARFCFTTWPDVTFSHLEWGSHAWPGGYQIHYVTKDGGVLCHNCANDNLMRTIDPDDEQFYIVDGDVHWEGAPLMCDHCGREIESEYGDPDAED